MTIIYISGIDGCGKTTQSTLLVEWMKTQNFSAEYQWLRWEPSVIPVLKRIKRLLGKTRATSHKSTVDTSAENIHHGKWSGIKEKLMSNQLFRKFWMWYSTRDYFLSYKKASQEWNSTYVVMDRYIFDFVVDQALNFSEPPLEFQNKLTKTVIADMQMPAYSIFIDLPAEVGYQRKLDGTPLEYLRERESLYKSIPSSDTILHIDGTQPPEAIHSNIVEWLGNQIGANK
jgi:thymidylate kinase